MLKRFNSTLSISLIASSLFIFSTPSAVAGTPPAGKVWAGSAHFQWSGAKSINGKTAASVTDLTFPLMIKESTLRKEGLFLAYQYYFTKKHSEIPGYLGLQPLSDENGKQRLRAIFSSFNPEATTTDSNCRGGADGGKGVSCSVTFNTTYGSKYDIKIHKIGDHVWSGDLIDSGSGKKIHLGSYKLPESTGDLQLMGTGFLEYYGGHPEWTVNRCSELPKISAEIGPIYSEDNGLTVTSIKSLTEQKPGSDGPLCHSPESGFVNKPVMFTIKYDHGNKTYEKEGRHLERGFLTN